MGFRLHTRVQTSKCLCLTGTFPLTSSILDDQFCGATGGSDRKKHRLAVSMILMLGQAAEPPGKYASVWPF